LNEQVRKVIEEVGESGRKIIEIPYILRTVEERLGTAMFELRGGYPKFASVIEDFCEEGMLSPVKKSGRFYRNPPLALKYRIRGIIGNRRSISREEEMILRQEIVSLHPEIKKDYYLKHLEHYIEDRDYILKLSNYLSDKDKNKSLQFRYTLNERSYEIFNDEKYLTNQGEKLLKRLGLDFEKLNCFKTYEAFFYILYKTQDEFAKNEHVKKGNVLIVENKDTFMSIVKLFNRKQRILAEGEEIDLLIYGEGKKIINCFKFIDEIGVNYKRIYYYGDIDYEGIGIFQGLRKAYRDYNIIPYVKLYEKLVDTTECPPYLKSKQEIIPVDEFLSFFDEYYRSKILDILEEGKYIPQEAFSFGKL